MSGGVNDDDRAAVRNINSSRIDIVYVKYKITVFRKSRGSRIWRSNYTQGNEYIPFQRRNDALLLSRRSGHYPGIQFGDIRRAASPARRCERRFLRGRREFDVSVDPCERSRDFRHGTRGLPNNSSRNSSSRSTGLSSREKRSAPRY